MTIRTTEGSVKFEHTFTLKGLERAYPSGTYRVVTDEELIDGLSFAAYRRVSTMLLLPGLTSATVEMITIDPADLEAAQLRDGAQAPDSSNPSATRSIQ